MDDAEAKKAAEAEALKKAEEAKANEDAKKTFTQEDLDRVAGERAKRAEEKAAKDLAAAIKKEREEWERQAKLSQEERDAEARKAREAETAEREKTITLRENRAEAREILQSKNISSDLVDFVVDVDIEKTKSNIDSLEKSFLKAVEIGVAEKLKGKTPEEKNNNKDDTTKYSGQTVL